MPVDDLDRVQQNLRVLLLGIRPCFGLVLGASVLQLLQVNGFPWLSTVTIPICVFLLYATHRIRNAPPLPAGRYRWFLRASWLYLWLLAAWSAWRLGVWAT